MKIKSVAVCILLASYIDGRDVNCEVAEGSDSAYRPRSDGELDTQILTCSLTNIYSFSGRPDELEYVLDVGVEANSKEKYSKISHQL